MNSSRSDAGGSGSDNTSVLVIGGDALSLSNAVESWNGSNVTAVNSLNTARSQARVTGTQTAALAYGGDAGPPRVTAATEMLSGAKWTNVNDMKTARRSVGGAGPNTAALAFGGYNGTARVGNTEIWNGTNWSEDAD